MPQCVEMVGSDDRMDHESGFGPSLNPLPPRCSHCNMPDLDHGPRPYLLGRGITSPAHMAPADAGNFLVRESAKRVLETVASGACHFYPTLHAKTRETTPWFLAVPQHMENLATPPENVVRCPKCNEPWSFQSSSQPSPVGPHDVFKSRNWYSFDKPFEGWDQKRPKVQSRSLYFSVRLEKLFKKLRMRGLVRLYKCKEEPSKEDLAWIDEKLRLLNSCSPSQSVPATGEKDWFAGYVKKHARKKPHRCDFAALEKKHRALPESYKQFMTAIGPKTFKDVEGEEGYNVEILPLAKLDFEFSGFTEARRKRSVAQPILFAVTEHGDAFCFKATAKIPDYEVHRYDHEMDDFEPFTKNFAAFIKRLTDA